MRGTQNGNVPGGFWQGFGASDFESEDSLCTVFVLLLSGFSTGSERLALVATREPLGREGAGGFSVTSERAVF